MSLKILIAELVFFWFLLPDVKGRSLEEIDELFEKKISVKEFPKYQCEISTRAHDIAIHRDEKREQEHVERVETV
jgi:hypothetical protein